MKVTIYTTSTCQFSKAEKEYLQSKNVMFEEKNVELNRDLLNELMIVSDNFAGTPVTKVEKDDGQTMVLKGFTQEEFDKVFAPTVHVVKVAQQQPEPPQAPTPTPPTPTPAPEPPVVDTPPPPPEPAPPPAPEPTPEPPQAETPPPPVSEPPKPEPVQQQAQSNDALDAILKDLQSKVNETYSAQQTPSNQPVDKPQEPTTPPPPSPQPTPQTPPPQPSTPQNPNQTPPIPDFPK